MQLVIKPGSSDFQWNIGTALHFVMGNTVIPFTFASGPGSMGPLLMAGQIFYCIVPENPITNTPVIAAKA